MEKFMFTTFIPPLLIFTITKWTFSKIHSLLICTIKKNLKREMVRKSVILGFLLTVLTTVIKAEDPYLFFTWKVMYGTISPLGVPQKAFFFC
ncbi:hypothetical protein YC2023_122729 [Brassica napus]